jgi:hypothetical protein
MEIALKIIGRIGLVLTLVPSFLYLFGMMELGTVKWVMIAGTVMWMVAAPMIQKLNKAA